jgi:hypothetical protein
MTIHEPTVHEFCILRQNGLAQTAEASLRICGGYRRTQEFEALTVFRINFNTYTYMYRYLCLSLSLYIYIYETCAWTPNYVFL